MRGLASSSMGSATGLQYLVQGPELWDCQKSHWGGEGSMGSLRFCCSVPAGTLNVKCSYLEYSGQAIPSHQGVWVQVDGCTEGDR